MTNNTNDTFSTFTDIDKTILGIQSDRIKEGLEHFVANKLDGIRISPYLGFKLQSLDFLKDYPEFWNEINYISIDEGVTDISSLKYLAKLKFLLIEQKNPKIDFSCFPELETLIITGGTKIDNLEYCKKLLSLTIYHYSPKLKDLSELPSINWIKELCIIHSTITSLNGMEKFDNLEKASFSYCSKLKDLCCLSDSANTLKFLEFENCKGIDNYEYVTVLRNLEILAYNVCGSIPSLKFLDQLSRLKDFRFVDTDIIDGDLTPVLRLDNAGFFNKRHFSHTFEQVKSIQEKRLQ